MPTIQISYTPNSDGQTTKNDDPDSLARTFVLNIDEDAYAQLLHGVDDADDDLSIRCNQFEILTFQHADGATLEKARPHDLWQGFGHKDEYHVAYIIAHKGHLEGTFPKANELHNEIFA